MKVLMKLKNEKTKKICFQYGISFPAWPQKISVSSYRKELKKPKLELLFCQDLRDIWTTGGAASHSPGDEFDIFAYKGLS